MRRIFPLVFCGTVIATPAAAEIRVIFTEGAPTNQFRIVNDGPCDLEGATLVIDLSTSPAGLIFDPTTSGAGVSVAQPFELAAGAQHVAAISPVEDGDTAARIELRRFGAGDVIAFTADLDDSMVGRPSGQTRIDGGEIAGAQAIVEGRGSGVFDAGGVARIPSCGATS